MYRIMYLSTAVIPFSDEELEALLEVARVNNKKRGVTGLLILKGRSFLQCLEGNKEDVEAIYEKIKKDERHDSLIKVVEEDDVSPYFPDWSMGYKNFNHMDAVTSQKIKDFSELENVQTLSEDYICEIFKEFIEVK